MNRSDDHRKISNFGSIRVGNYSDIDQSEIPFNEVPEFGSDTNRLILNEICGSDVSERLIKKFGHKLFKNFGSSIGFSLPSSQIQTPIITKNRIVPGWSITSQISSNIPTYIISE